MIPRDFDRHYERTRRRIVRTQRAIFVAIVVFWALIIGAAIWIALHPENVGAFFGRIVSGFYSIGTPNDR